MEKIIQALLKNTPLALVVIGLLLAVIGASGGMEKLAIKVDDPRWRVALGVMGIVVAGFGALLIWRVRKDVDPQVLAQECELKITAPLNGAVVDESTQFAGSFKNLPHEGSIVLIEQSVSTGDYWFKKRPVIDEKNKQWYIDSRVGGDPGKERVIYLAILGKSGQALWDYYQRVGQETKQWPAMRSLTTDISICDNVRVRRR